MKSGKLVLLSLVTILVLTGCGKKELTCTMSQTQNGVKMDSEVVIKFDGKTVEDMNMTMDVEIPESLQEQKELLKSSFEAQTFKVEESEKGLKLTADAESKFFKDLKLGESKASYDDTKEALEGQGFTCK
ncbi:MAG: hypothetical protein HFE04_01700 [Bacilli bacterium]|nr:hypothetical protein [Bacilli bacterium]